MQKITQEVMSRIEASQGSDVVSAMQKIAMQVLKDGVSCDEDFERLVGAFDAQRRTLELMRLLAGATAGVGQDKVDALKVAVDFTQETLDMGVSHVLQVIAERSIASESLRLDLDSLVKVVSDSFDGNVTFGNLNYDSLLLASLTSGFGPKLADMASGYEKTVVTINGISETFPSLRKSGDFPSDRRILLLQLHGCICFWRDRRQGVTAKLSTDIVRDPEIWDAVRSGDTNIRPMVVLSSRHDKAQQVLEQPFNIAYEKFRESISTSNAWIVIGYSFRDAPVNELLRSEFLKRSNKPSVLISTYGTDLARVAVEQAFGWGAEDGSSDSWLTISRDGASGLEKSVEWEIFMGK
ncbi:SIR2 family protein [Dermacoccus abyssi]|uniref:SIR2 family protein n=1 Tax=Dermacoccus abyssi TaxID=322596 RepID=UPI0021A60793|nr:SIR2 family protein [Dermacoccus abyssi]MCT1986759.1 SIR2 family protein [Dermacoccus abyssi]